MLTAADALKAKEEHASKFRIGNPVLEEMHDAGTRDVLGISDEDFIVYAHMVAPYEGEPPEDYRVLNFFVMDLVTQLAKSLEPVLAPLLLDYLRKEYGDGDLSELEQGIDDFIWESQTDYMPMVDPDSKTLHFDIELVLSMDSEEGDPDLDVPPDEA